MKKFILRIDSDVSLEDLLGWSFDSETNERRAMDYGINALMCKKLDNDSFLFYQATRRDQKNFDLSVAYYLGNFLFEVFHKKTIPYSVTFPK